MNAWKYPLNYFKLGFLKSAEDYYVCDENLCTLL